MGHRVPPGSPNGIPVCANTWVKAMLGSSTTATPPPEGDWQVEHGCDSQGGDTSQSYTRVPWLPREPFHLLKREQQRAGPCLQAQLGESQPVSHPQLPGVSLHSAVEALVSLETHLHYVNMVLF